jgi:hypothetical protein
VVRKIIIKKRSLRDLSRHRYKRTSIGNSSNSFGAGQNKRDNRKKYRGQGK